VVHPVPGGLREGGFLRGKLVGLGLDLDDACMNDKRKMSARERLWETK